MKSIKVVYVLMLFFLIGIGYESFNELYILLKQSIASSNVPYIIFYVAKIVAGIMVLITIAKLENNVKKQIIFERKNLRLLKIMSISVLCPVFAILIGNILTGKPMGEDIKFWILGSLLLVFITQVFKKGIELKEEQDLTV